MKTLSYINSAGGNVLSLDGFGGLNSNFIIAENELADSFNMSCADYPALSVRRMRRVLKADGADGFTMSVPEGFSSAVIHDGKAVFLTRTGRLFYEDRIIALNVRDNKLLRLGNMLYTYPDGVLVRLPSSSDGEIEIEYSYKRVEFSENASDGVYSGLVGFFPVALGQMDRTSLSVKPSDPQPGDYFSSADGLKIYADTGSGEYGWVSAEPDGIAVYALTADGYVDFSGIFKAGDAVFISGATDSDGGTVDALNSSFIVDSVGEGENGEKYMFLGGYFNTFASCSECIIEKKIPYGLDFVIEHNNRLWGCFCGYDGEGNFLNEIYATAMNDPTNWYRFDGTLGQSYAVSLVSDGGFTAAAVMGGYPTFFKENCLYRIYGDSPADFQLASYECAGVQAGCEGSLAGVNGVYFYKSNLGIMRMTDGYPTLVSQSIDCADYSDAVGGTDGFSYYVSMKNGDEVKMFVYDIARGIWHCEDSPAGVRQFFSHGNSLYFVADSLTDEAAEECADYWFSYLNAKGDDTVSAVVRLGFLSSYIARALLNCENVTVYSLSKKENISLPALSIPPVSVADEGDYEGVDNSRKEISLYDEGEIRWHFETGAIGRSDCTAKYADRLIIRLFAATNSRADVEIAYDSGGEWESAGCIDGAGGVGVRVMEIRPQRRDSFRLRFSGFGDVKLMNISVFYSKGSEIQ